MRHHSQRRTGSIGATAGGGIVILTEVTGDCYGHVTWTQEEGGCTMRPTLTLPHRRPYTAHVRENTGETRKQGACSTCSRAT